MATHPVHIHFEAKGAVVRRLEEAARAVLGNPCAVCGAPSGAAVVYCPQGEARARHEVHDAVDRAYVLPVCDRHDPSLCVLPENAARIVAEIDKAAEKAYRSGK